MRVLFTTWNSPSHLFPSVPLARALRDRGHDVRVAAPPRCTPSIAAAGLRPQPVGVDIDISATSARGTLASWHRQQSWPSDWPVHPERLGEAERGILRALGGKQIRIADAMVEDLMDAAFEFRPELVVHDAGTYAGRVVAQVLGVPSVSHLWGSPAIMRLELRNLLGEPLPGYAELSSRFGVAGVADSTVWLDPCPPSLQLPSDTVRTPVRPEPYNGPGAVPDWLTRPPARPRIAITWGVTAAKLQAAEAPPLLRHAVAAAARTGAEVVLALPGGQRDLLGALPERVRVVENLPLRHLLPTCRAIVHQGGGGTTLTALACGVPQVVVSPRPEQMVTGARLALQGAARHHVGNELAAHPAADDVLHADLASLLDEPCYERAAAGLAAEAAAMPSADRVAQQLVALARDGGLRAA